MSRATNLSRFSESGAQALITPGIGRGRAITAALLGASLVLGGCGVFRGAKPKSRTIGERVSVLNFEQQVAAEAELADLAVVLPPAEVNADWTQPGGSATKAVGHLALGAGTAEAWRVSVGRGSDATRRLNAAPVVARNRLFAMDVEANVSAFDATTGAVLWRAAITREGEDRRAAFGGGVSTDGERVYATSGYGVVAAFDAATGSQVWRKQLATPLRSAPAVEGGRVYVMTQDSQLQALDAATGEQAWEANATQEPAGILSGGSPAVAQDTVVAGFGSGETSRSTSSSTLAAPRPEIAVTDSPRISLADFRACCASTMASIS